MIFKLQPPILAIEKNKLWKFLGPCTTFSTKNGKILSYYPDLSSFAP